MWILLTIERLVDCEGSGGSYCRGTGAYHCREDAQGPLARRCHKQDQALLTTCIGGDQRDGHAMQALVSC